MGRKHGSTTKSASALYIHVRNGDVDKVRRLLQQEEDPNQREANLDFTPLGSLVFAPPPKNAFKLAELLHDFGADVDAVGRNRKTPLYIAVNCGRVDWIEWLIEHGADPHLKLPGRKSPLELVQGSGKTMAEMFKRILEHRQVSQDTSVVSSQARQRARL